MKITIYELLGMVKDGKELPKLENKAERDFDYYVYEKWGEVCNLKDLKNLLNDTVEILEEEKEIPEKLKDIAVKDGMVVRNWTYKERVLADKIDEIIDYLKSKGE